MHRPRSFTTQRNASSDGIAGSTWTRAKDHPLPESRIGHLGSRGGNDGNNSIDGTPSVALQTTSVPRLRGLWPVR